MFEVTREGEGRDEIDNDGEWGEGRRRWEEREWRKRITGSLPLGGWPEGQMVGGDGATRADGRGRVQGHSTVRAARRIGEEGGAEGVLSGRILG